MCLWFELLSVVRDDDGHYQILCKWDEIPKHMVSTLVANNWIQQGFSTYDCGATFGYDNDWMELDGLQELDQRIVMDSVYAGVFVLNADFNDYLEWLVDNYGEETESDHNDYNDDDDDDDDSDWLPENENY